MVTSRGAEDEEQRIEREQPQNPETGDSMPEGLNNPTNIFTTFFNQGGNLAALITPYALQLVYLLLFIEYGTIAITWMRGNDDVPDLLWRVVYLPFPVRSPFGGLPTPRRSEKSCSGVLV